MWRVGRERVRSSAGPAVCIGLLLAIDADCDAKQDAEGSGKDARDPVQQDEDGIQLAGEGGVGGGAVARNQGESGGGERRSAPEGLYAGLWQGWGKSCARMCVATGMATKKARHVDLELSQLYDEPCPLERVCPQPPTRMCGAGRNGWMAV